MARLPGICPPDIPQHIIQRGNNRQACFACEEDFSAYAHWLIEACRKQAVAVHAWVFMTNHVHLLATPSTEHGISRMMQMVGRRYVHYFNRTYKRSGTLWEGRFKSCVVDAENYLLICQRYIELNPVRAGMVRSPAEYKWSSYHANGLYKTSQLWQPHPIWTRLGRSNQQRTQRYRQLLQSHLDAKVLNEVRCSLNKGLALGNDKFRKEIEELTGRRVTPLKIRSGVQRFLGKADSEFSQQQA